MTKIANAWGDGRDADVKDCQCEGRPCLHVAEHKGSFRQGQGYTSYFKNPQLVCWTRHLHGCPSPIPEVEPERMRCCPHPVFPQARVGTRKQRCKSCGQWAEGWVLDIRRGLPEQPHVECRHDDLVPDEVCGRKLTRCRKCHLFFKGTPKPLAQGQTFKEVLDELFPTPPPTA